MGIGFAFLLTVGFLSIAIGLRYLLGKAAHSYHPDGARGYLKDILLDVAISYAPLLSIIFAVRVYIEIYPQYANSPMVMVSIGVAVAAMLLARRLPIIKAANARLTEARNQRWDALKAEHEKTSNDKT
jgi:hypothetical protein